VIDIPALFLPFIVFLLGPLCQDATAPPRAKVPDVCEVLGEMNVRAERANVQVRGVYFGDLEEPCEKPVILGEHQWPSAISVIGPRQDSAGWKSWDGLHGVVVKEAQRGSRGAIWVTITGRLLGPWHTDDHGNRIYGGYGHLGAFPAEIIVDHVSDIELKPTPKLNYREMFPRRPHM
jgi:hypothetical protein